MGSLKSSPPVVAKLSLLPQTLVALSAPTPNGSRTSRTASSLSFEDPTEAVHDTTGRRCFPSQPEASSSTLERPSPFTSLLGYCNSLRAGLHSRPSPACAKLRFLSSTPPRLPIELLLIPNPPLSSSRFPPILHYHVATASTCPSPSLSSRTGDTALSVVASRLWNALPVGIRSSLNFLDKTRRSLNHSIAFPSE